jgi:hypothetical protein
VIRLYAAMPAAVADATEAQREVLRTFTAQQEAQVRDALAAVRQSLLAELAATDPERLPQRADALLRLLDDAAARFAAQATATITGGQEAAVGLGQAMVDAPLAAGGVLVSLPEVTLDLLDTLLEFAADKVTGLTEDLVARVTAEIQLGVLGTQTPDETMTALREFLRTEAAGKTGLAARAEAIARTETGRVHSAAAQRWMDQALTTLPDLEKEWRRVPASQPFYVAPVVGAPAEALMYPRDPAGSARNCVNCRCSSLPWLARWAEEA